MARAKFSRAHLHARFICTQLPVHTNPLKEMMAIQSDPTKKQQKKSTSIGARYIFRKQPGP